MEVRRYREGDRAGCLGVFGSNMPGDFLPGEREAFAGFLDELPGPYWVLEEDGRIVGCGGVAIEADGETASLCWGMVARERHGQGLGRRLLEARLEWARQTPGVKRVALTTGRPREGFFGRFGFRTLRVVPDGHGPGVDAVEMGLDVDL